MAALNEKRAVSTRVNSVRNDDPDILACAFYLFIRQPMGRKSALRRAIPWDSARNPRTSKLLICVLFQKGRVLAQDGVSDLTSELLY